MVTCKLYGRYGNQLFQVAATIAYSLKHNMEYAIPENGSNFGMKTNYKFPNQKNISLPKIYKQPNHGYNEIPYFKDIVLDGHFQSEKYFERFKKEISNILGFSDATINKCAIHVRRGDYLYSQDCFPVLNMQYYKQSILEMIKRDVSKFVIFSDDIDWCKNNFIGSGYEFYNSGNDIEDLKYMSSFEYLIIANSSYSLFSSIINDKKCVISPNHNDWFGSKINLKTEDLLPERFIQI